MSRIPTHFRLARLLLNKLFFDFSQILKKRHNLFPTKEAHGLTKEAHGLVKFSDPQDEGILEQIQMLK